MKFQLLWVDKTKDSVHLIERKDDPRELMALAKHMCARNHRGCPTIESHSEIRVLTNPNYCFEPNLMKVEGFFAVLPAG